MTTLISFLGKGGNGGGYRPACYQFADGHTDTQPFFGLALAKHLGVKRLLLVGTAGSCWDVFFGREESQNNDALLTLIEAVEHNAVTHDLLQQFEKPIAERLGLAVECVLIGYARTDAEQVELLQQLAQRLEPQEHVVMDVTHSFRHLPMLALVAARYLRFTRAVVVDDIYYGALEMTISADPAPRPPPPQRTAEKIGRTPVLKLSGMLRMLDWVDALASFEKDGDYGVFAQLLRNAGLPNGDSETLRTAAFMERVNFATGARERLDQPLKAVAQLTDPMVTLFREPLEKSLAWRREGSRDERELALAKTWLTRGDYLRSAIFLQEGLITAEVLWQTAGNPDEFQHRNQARQALHDELPDFRKLEKLRNALAHGQRPDDKTVSKLLGDEQELVKHLKKLTKNLPAALQKRHAAKT